MQCAAHYSYAILYYSTYTYTHAGRCTAHCAFNLGQLAFSRFRYSTGQHRTAQCRELDGPLKRSPSFDPCALHADTPYHTGRRRFHHMKRHCIALHYHITSHHITSHDIASHRVASHRAASSRLTAAARSQGRSRSGALLSYQDCN